MASLSEVQESFIGDKPVTGVITTLRADGSPHSTVVWIDLDGGDIVFNTAEGRAKERHLRSDPRACLIVIDPESAYRWVSINGSATLEIDEGTEMIDRLAQKFLGKDYPREWMAPGEVRVTVRIKPEKIDSYGFDA